MSKLNITLFCSVFFLFSINALHPLAAEDRVFIPDHTSSTSPYVPSSLLPGEILEEEKDAAQKVTLYTPGMNGIPDATIELEWSDSYLARDTFKYNHALARIMCTFALSSYTDIKVIQQKEEQNKINCLDKNFTALGFKEDSIFYNYDIDFSDEEVGHDQVAFSIASKTLPDGQNVVFLVVRGTVVLEEWLSNLNMADSNKKSKEVPLNHEGFMRASILVYEDLLSYMERHGISINNAIFMLTGHSRGAAVCNLIGVRLLHNGVSAKNIYDYTVACPNVTRASDVCDSKYNYIWNIINQEDLVTSMPFSDGAWGYHKYGHELSIINSFTCTDYKKYEGEYITRMNEYFSLFCQRNFYPFKTGNFLPYIFSTLLRMINSDPTRFYKSIFPLHDVFANSVNSLFYDTSTEEKEPSALKKLIEREAPGALDYAYIAINDMHACEAYLAWLLTLDASELYSTGNTFIIEFSGKVNLQVTDESGRVYIDIKNNIPENPFKIQGFPAVWFFEGSVYMCVPGNRDLKMTISAPGILDTYVKLKVKTYSAGGSLKSTTTYNHLYTGYSTMYTVDFKDSSFTLYGTKGSGARAFAKEKMPKDFILRPELVITRGYLVGLALQAEYRHVYARAGAVTNNYIGFNSTDLFLGLGAQTYLVGTTIMGLEAEMKGVFNLSSIPDDFFYMVPYMGLMFAFQPYTKLHLRVSVGADFCIREWNDKAFGLNMQPTNAWTVPLGDMVTAYPMVEFSVQF